MNFHPGALAALKRLEGDELDIAELMAAGDLTSPQIYKNVTLFNIRITGTGVAYRPAHDEYVYRQTEDYLTERFLKRIAGLMVIMHHPPKKGILDSDEFDERAVGAVMLPYIQGDEVWAIVRIYDDEAIEQLKTEQMSTSPAILLDKTTSFMTRTTLKDGSKVKVLTEGAPRLVDHIAICTRGVWDKGKGPLGVETEAIIRGDSIMADEDNRKKEEEERKDAARMDEKFDMLLKKVDAACESMAGAHRRMDAWEDEKEKEKKDAAVKADAAARKDAEEKEKEEKGKKEEAEKLAADKARKDAEEESKKEKEEKREDSTRSDAVDKQLKEALAKIEELTTLVRQPIPDADRKGLASAQSRADSVFVALGREQAKPPLVGESVTNYRRRLLSEIQDLSPRWKDKNLSRLDDEMFSTIENDVYADAATAARNPIDIKPGQYRQLTKRTSAGHMINEYAGAPGTHFVQSFRRPLRRVAAIDDGRAYR